MMKISGYRSSRSSHAASVPIVLPLEDLRLEQASQFGGKAAMLGAMLADGLTALQGVAVSTEAYESALDSVGATELANAFWEHEWSDHASGDALKRVSDDIARHLVEADLSETANAVLAQLSMIQGAHPELIVRSSATGEDSTQLSYAGQFSSQRCSGDQAGLEAAIARVWASCTAPHVVAYRSAIRGRDPDGTATKSPSMALVVQPYRRFSTSGLIFTQHPTVALRGWMFLEYLDEEPARLVSGEVVPHACRVNAASGRVVWERRIEGRPVLMPQSISDLIAGAERLKRLANTDVDIEWGELDSTVYFLQSRPATTGPIDT